MTMKLALVIVGLVAAIPVAIWLYYASGWSRRFY